MSTDSPHTHQLNLRGKELDLSTPRVMGILNVTPDSFSDGGEFDTVDKALGQIGLMVGQGADIIDVGGESTRPGSEPVTEEEELERVLPVLERAVGEFSETLFSIDTTKHRVASEALDLGVHIVNDVSGLQKEPLLADLCARHGAGYILMHSQGNPKTMQDEPRYEDVVSDIRRFFIRQLEIAKEKGVTEIILDPGIGFGKTLEHNLKILARLRDFQELGYPIMVGASRKSMIGQLLDGRPVEERLTGTIAIHYDALNQGATLLRVHDVKEAVDSVKVFDAINRYR